MSDRISLAEYRRSAGKKRSSKYGSVRTINADGSVADSKHEAGRLGDLRLLERAGEISDLRTQVPFALVVNGIHVCTYIADAVYRDRHGREVVEDAKSPPTRAKPEYKIKAKLFVALFNRQIQEYQR